MVIVTVIVIVIVIVIGARQRRDAAGLSRVSDLGQPEEVSGSAIQILLLLLRIIISNSTTTNNNNNNNNIQILGRHRNVRLRPVRLLRVWVSEGLTQTLNSKGWEFSCPYNFIGSLPESLTQGLLVGKLLVGGLGVTRTCHFCGCRARRGDSRGLDKSSPYASPSRGAEVARLRKSHVNHVLQYLFN